MIKRTDFAVLVHRKELSTLVVILSFIHSFCVTGIHFICKCDECMHTHIHTHTALYYKHMHCYYSGVVNCTTGECWCHVTEEWIAWQWVVFALSFIIRVLARGGSWLWLGTNSKTFVDHKLHKCICGARYELTKTVTCTYEWSSILMTNSYFIYVGLFEETSWSKERNDHLFELCW